MRTTCQGHMVVWGQAVMRCGWYGAQMVWGLTLSGCGWEVGRALSRFGRYVARNRAGMAGYTQ